MELLFTPEALTHTNNSNVLTIALLKEATSPYCTKPCGRWVDVVYCPASAIKIMCACFLHYYLVVPTSLVKNYMKQLIFIGVHIFCFITVGFRWSKSNALSVYILVLFCKPFSVFYAYELVFDKQNYCIHDYMECWVYTICTYICSELAPSNFFYMYGWGSFLGS
jgi:hypothetical protein